MTDNFKIEDVSPETLETRTSYTKDEEPIETISMPTIDIPNYDYGRSQETLDYETQIRNTPSVGGNYKVGSFNITGTGTKTITGVGFTPKLVQIFADHSNIGSCQGSSDGTNQWTKYYDATNGTGQATNLIIWLRDNGVTKTQAQFGVFNSDGFTISVNYNVVTANCTYICHG